LGNTLRSSDLAGLFPPTLYKTRVVPAPTSWSTWCCASAWTTTATFRMLCPPLFRDRIRGNASPIYTRS